MKLLLDTHAFLWYISNDARLPQHACDAIRDKSNEVYLSVVSVWEILVKYQIGKLPLPTPADEFIEATRSEHRIEDPRQRGVSIESKTCPWIVRQCRTCYPYRCTIEIRSIACSSARL
jgi:PIN domain nuclease of toxin-antitoxin system